MSSAIQYRIHFFIEVIRAGMPYPDGGPLTPGVMNQGKLPVLRYT